MLAQNQYPFPSTALGFHCVNWHAKDKVMSLKEKSPPLIISPLLPATCFYYGWNQRGHLNYEMEVLWTTEKQERNSLYFLHYKDVIPVDS